MPQDTAIGPYLGFNSQPYKKRSSRSILEDFTEEPTGQYYPITDKRTGKSYKMEWNHDTPPSKMDVYNYIDEQERPKSLWEKANTGLSDFPSRVGKAVAGPLWRYGEGEEGKGVLGKLARGGAAFSESLGGVGDSLTSPLSLGLAALTGGTGLAAKLGAPEIAGALHGASRVAGAGQALHGGYNVYEGIEEGDTAKALGGAIEGLTGGAMAASPYARALSEKPPLHPHGPYDYERPPIDVNPRGGSARYGPPKPPIDDFIDAEFSSKPTDDLVRNPPGRRPGQRLLNERNIPDAEFSEVQEPPAAAPRVPPGLPRRGGSAYQRPEPAPPDPMGHKFFQGETGTSDNFSDVDAGPSLPTSFGRRSLLARSRNFGRKANEGYYKPGAQEPIPDIPEALPVRESPLADMEPPPQEPVTTPPEVRTNPFAQADDADVSFLALDGNADAIAEARRRPSLRERFMDETGAIGDLKRLKALAQGRYRDKGPKRYEAATELPVSEANSAAAVDRGLSWENGLVDKLVPIGPKGPLYGQRRGGEAAPDSLVMRRALEAKLEALPEDSTFPPDSKKGRQLKAIKRHLVDTINKLVEDETGAVGPGADPLIKERARLRRERAAAGRKGMPPPDSFDAGLADAPPKPGADEPIDIVRQLLDSLKQSRIVKDQKGTINIPGVDFKLPKFLRERDLPKQFEEWVGQRQANRYKYRTNKEARKVANQIANEQFRGWLNSMGYIRPDNKGGGIGKMLDTAPEDLREAIENYYTKPNKTMKWVADKATLSKNFAMSAGLPYSGVNAHGFNILARSIIGNPKEAMKVGKYLLNPRDAFLRLAGKTGETSPALDFNAMKPTAEWAIKKGLTFTSEGHDINTVGSTNLAGKTIQGFLKKQGEMFEDPLFRQILPAVKLKHFNDMVEDLVADGLSRDLAGRQAARFVNNLYGGINWEMLGANRDLQNIARAIILAPDWLKTNVNLGKGTASALLSRNTEAGKQYRQVAVGMLGAYLAADAMNYAVNGEHMFQNDPGHSFDIHIGRSGNRERYFRPFGTAADFLRLPTDIVSSMAQGDLGQGFRVIKNRASIPASSTINLVWNENRFGRPIFGKDVYGKQIPIPEQLTGAASEVGNVFMPAYVRALKDSAIGRVGAEEATLGGIEAPFRYSNVPRDPRRRRARRRTR